MRIFLQNDLSKQKMILIIVLVNSFGQRKHFAWCNKSKSNFTITHTHIFSYNLFNTLLFLLACKPLNWKILTMKFTSQVTWSSTWNKNLIYIYNCNPSNLISGLKERLIWIYLYSYPYSDQSNLSNPLFILMHPRQAVLHSP